MKTQIISLLIIFTLQSCNNNSGEKNSQDLENSYNNWEGCYAFIQNDDSIRLKLEFNGNEVTGNLTYNFYEKDDNKGSLTGKVYGDTIIAMYNFDSEGVASFREVAFLKRGNEYVEGFGEIEEKEGKMTFKNRKNLNYDSNVILTKTDCY